MGKTSNIITHVTPTAEFFETQEFPATVYKFRDWGIAFHKSLLAGDIYLSSPEQFNDPFDCNIPVAYYLLRDNPELQHQYFAEFLERSRPQLDARQKETEVNRLISEGKFNDDNWIEQGITQNKKHFSELGVFCLSGSKHELLLWSHYANSHRGFCVGFNAKELFKEMLITHRIGGGDVSYRDEYPVLSPITDFAEQFRTQLTFKSSDWKYEKEIRLFKLFAARKSFRIPTSIITEINLGCNISDEHKNEIIQYVFNNLPHVKIFQGRMVRGKFAVEFVEVGKHQNIK